MTLRTEGLLGDGTMRAAMYGPLALAANVGAGPVDGPMKFGGYDTAPKALPPAEAAPEAPADGVEVVSAKELRFKAGTLEVMPMYRIADEKYAVYWKTKQA